MKRTQRVTATLAAALGLTFAGNALAADGFYFGLGGGLSSIDAGSEGELEASERALFEEVFPVLDIASDLDDSDIGWSAQVGYRWGSYIAAEVGYVDLGETTYHADVLLGPPFGAPFVAESDLRFSATGVTASVLGMLPLSPRFDLHGRVGVLFAETKAYVRVTSGGSSGSDELESDSKDLFAGIGGAWNINDSYTLRVEYQRYFDVGDDEDLGDELDVDMLSVHFLFR